ncbi:hypothetical protein FN846DRAFT_896167 [Sphaerosporella brunnea]|uniref:Uncharacterized protein n=1 Tax=Sphaerosporella brunnea TaxID=1250544 RepID=A0A5J5EDA3_9PEZI|nr:hypothetical protein FN846DRAFT_896167 [Sphaerosporella brunnea]
MTTFIRSFIQGRPVDAAAPDASVAAAAADAPDDAVVVTPAAAGETSPATGIQLPLPLYRALPDNHTTVPWIPESGESDDFKTHKRMPKRKRKAKMPIKNDNPRKVPKLKSDTSASDNGLAATLGSSSAPAVQRNTRSINVDVPNYQGMDIAWNLNPNGAVSAVTFSFGGSTS